MGAQAAYYTFVCVSSGHQHFPQQISVVLLKSNDVIFKELNVSLVFVLDVELPGRVEVDEAQVAAVIQKAELCSEIRSK